MKHYTPRYHKDVAQYLIDGKKKQVDDKSKSINLPTTHYQKRKGN